MTNQDVKPIGTTKGPGETAHEYTFVTPDTTQQVKAGEFVYYDTDVDGEQRRILGRITERRPLRLYPDTFLADPDVSPDDVASLVGYDSPDYELFEVTAIVLGYYSESLGDFINPRLPPRAGKPIYLASDKMLSEVLTRRRQGEVGSATVGSLLSRGEGRVPIALDVAALTSTHMAIIASTGAGKSYLAGVLVEEMLRPYNRASVLIIDPHGEADTLGEMQNEEAFVDGDYRPEVRVFQPGEVKVRVSSLKLGDMYYLLPNLTEPMEHLLRKGYENVRDHAESQTGNRHNWTVPDLREKIHQFAEGDDDDARRYQSTVSAVDWRLDSILNRSVLFDNYKNLDLQELFEPGRCTVLQFNEVDEQEQQMMVATLLRRLFQARKDTEKGNAVEGDDLYLPYPTFVLIEEAHNFAPASDTVASTNILKQILSEGRKFGVSVGLISQRPGKLDGDVLSQCNTQFLMRIVNPVDQARVAESVETVGRDLLDELPALSKGQAIVAGNAVNTPLLCRVRRRITPHGGESKNAPAEWLAYFSDEARAKRKRNKAPIKPPSSQGFSDLPLKSK